MILRAREIGHSKIPMGLVFKDCILRWLKKNSRMGTTEGHSLLERLLGL
jgi:hypothetical protein